MKTASTDLMGTVLPNISVAKRRWLASALLIILGVLFFTDRYDPDKVQTAKRGEIQRLIAKAPLAGANARKVADFLSANHIEHSPYDKKTGIILAIIRDTSRGIFSEGNVQIVFLFGHDEKLSSYRLKDIYTGL